MKLYETMNLHSHTYRCHHAEGDVLDYAKEADRCGVKLLGISDHTPFPEKRDEGIRMELAEMPGYIAAIEQAAKAYPAMRIRKGLECDYTPGYVDFYRDLQQEYGLDYLIGSVHFYEQNGQMMSVFETPMDHRGMRLYTEQMLANIDEDLFAFIAHPDVFCTQLETWDDYVEDCVHEMCRLAEQKKRVLEINVNGLHKMGEPYPDERFWRIVGQYEIETLISSDAHKVERLCAKKEVGYAIQQKYQLRAWTPTL